MHNGQTGKGWVQRLSVLHCVVRLGLVGVFLFLLAGCGNNLIKLENAPQFTAPEGSELSGDVVLANEYLNLKLEAGTGRFTVTDQRNGYIWRSNPDANEIKASGQTGDWLGHVQSPFILEYRDLKAEASGSRTTRTNLSMSKATVKLYKRTEGIEIAYLLPESGLRFSFVIRLEGNGIKVDIPANRLSDSATAEMKSIWPYPFLGAVLKQSKEGYMLLPDGPGTLMNFYDNNYPYRNGYTGPVYGTNYSVEPPAPGTGDPAAYPVFGLKQAGNAFLAVIEQGEQNSRIEAYPSGPSMPTPFNWVTAEFLLKPSDYYTATYSSQAKQFVNDYMTRTDRSMAYYFLAGKDADYVGMAKAYRSHLMKTQGASQVKARPEDPMELFIYMGTEEPTLFDRRMVAATTFKEAQGMIKELHDNGVTSLNAVLVGWNLGGDSGYWPKRFPPDPSLGTSDDLRELIAYAKSVGTNLLLQDNFMSATTKKEGFNPRQGGIRGVHGKVAEEDTRLGTGKGLLHAITTTWISPKLSAEYLEKSLPIFKKWGINGLVVNKSGGNPDEDFNERYLSSRKTTMSTYNGMYRRTREELGEVQIPKGYAYTIGSVDFIKNFDLNSNIIQSETVPFYPIAIHGLVRYSGQPNNQLDEDKRDRLKAIEYGALPSYLLTHQDTTVLKNTMARYSIYSSKFDQWKQALVEDNKQYNGKIGETSHLFIEDHFMLAPDVYATLYEGGKKVIVNYGDIAYRLGNLVVPAQDFIATNESIPIVQGKEVGTNENRK